MTQADPDDEGGRKLSVGPEYAEWLRARGHYAIAVELASVEQNRRNPNLELVFWQWQICCTSIEVALKAFLLAANIGEDSNREERPQTRRILRKKYGHDLIKLARCGEDHSLEHHVDLSTDDFTLLNDFTPFYAQRLWIYAEVRGFVSLPRPIYLRRLCYKLLHGTVNVVDPREEWIRNRERSQLPLPE